MRSVGAKSPTDEQLVATIRSGNANDFSMLMARYQQRLFIYALRFVRDEDRACDVVQEAFIKMYRNLNSFDVDKNFSAWAYRITHNEAINFIKKYKREVVIVNDEWLNSIADEKVDLAAELDSKERDQQVREAVFKLPMKYAQVLALYYFEGKEYEQIAAILQIPASSVGTRLRRAKAKLQKSLVKPEVMQ